MRANCPSACTFRVENIKPYYEDYSMVIITTLMMVMTFLHAVYKLLRTFWAHQTESAKKLWIIIFSITSFCIILAKMHKKLSEFHNTHRRSGYTEDTRTIFWSCTRQRKLENGENKVVLVEKRGLEIYRPLCSAGLWDQHASTIT